MKNRQIIILTVILILIGIISIVIIKQLAKNNKNQTIIETYSIQDNIVENSISNEEQENIKMGELESQILEYLEQNNIEKEKIALTIQNLISNEMIEINQNEYFFAASIYKLPLALIYYDMINENKVSIEDKYQFLKIYQEDIGVLESKYEFGEYIEIGYLLEIMIKYSDNSAGHILFENLGGWEVFKEKIIKYSEFEITQEFLETNILTSNIINDILVYINENEEDYIKLIEDMKQANIGEYLDNNIEVDIAQKYGSYNEALNAVGIIYSEIPYSISIFTDLGYVEGIDLVSNINKICYDIFNKEEL